MLQREIKLPDYREAVRVEARLAQAHQALIIEKNDYAVLAEKTAKVLGPRHLLALVLDRGDVLAQSIRNHPLVEKALLQLKELGRSYPHLRDPFEWALFHNGDHEESERIALTIRENGVNRLAHRMDHRLNPTSVTAMLRVYFTEKLMGNQAGADGMYRDALGKGLPLPI